MLAGPIGLFSALDSPISLAFLTRYPSPGDARGLGEKRMASFLKAHHYTNRKTPAELLERLRSAATGCAGEIEIRTRRQIVLHLTRTLEVIVKQIAELGSEVAEALRAHPGREIFQSFFRSPNALICAATLLAEIGNCRQRYRIATRSLRRRPGAGRGRIWQTQDRQVPLGVQQAAPQRARVLAHSTTRWNAWAADRYTAAARARGHNHRRALRTLGRAWSRIIWSCWQTHTPYDPQRHTGLQQHITVTIPTPSGPRPDTHATQPMAGTALTPTASDSKPPISIRARG